VEASYSLPTETTLVVALSRFQLQAIMAAAIKAIYASI